MAIKVVTLLYVLALCFYTYATVEVSECSCDRQFVFGSEYVDYQSALILCAQLGMEIATPVTKTEEAALVTAYKAINPTKGWNYGSWIGAHNCTSCESSYIWTITGEPVVYSNFIPGHPVEHTIATCFLQVRQVNDNYGWVDTNCEDLHSYICQSRCCCNN